MNSKPTKVPRPEWERQTSLPVLARTHLTDEELCAGTKMDIRAARRLQADGAFRSTETSTSSGSLRLWDWSTAFKAATAEALHKFFGLTYPVVAEVIRGIPAALWERVLLTDEVRVHLGDTFDPELDQHLGIAPGDWFLLLAGRRVLLVSGDDVKDTGFNVLPEPWAERPVALLGELTEKGYRSLWQEALLPRDKKSGPPIDLNRAHADLAEVRLDNVPAVVRLNLSLVLRGCALRAAGFPVNEL